MSISMTEILFWLADNISLWRPFAYQGLAGIALLAIALSLSAIIGENT